MSDPGVTTTGVIGLGLASASGLVVFALAEYGPGIGLAVVAAFAAVTVLVGTVGHWSDALEWGVALPLGMVALALATIWAMAPPEPVPGLSMQGFAGLLLVGMGALALLSLPLARRVHAVGARLR